MVLPHLQHTVGGIGGRIHKEVRELYAEILRIVAQAGGALERGVGAQLSFDVDSLRSTSQADVSPKPFQGKVVAQLQWRLVKRKIPAVSGAGAQQEADIEPKRTIRVLQNGLGPIWVDTKRKLQTGT